jgi:hypothetical protein
MFIALSVLRISLFLTMISEVPDILIPVPLEFATMLSKIYPYPPQVIPVFISIVSSSTI